MEQIADEAGVAKATLYDNFDGKGGLTRSSRRRDAVPLTIASGLDQPRRPPRGVLRGGIEVFVAVIERDLARIASRWPRTAVAPCSTSPRPRSPRRGSMLRQAGGVEHSEDRLMGAVDAAIAINAGEASWFGLRECCEGAGHARMVFGAAATDAINLRVAPGVDVSGTVGWDFDQYGQVREQSAAS